MNLRLLFNPRAGVVGWLAFPFMVIFERLGPLVEVTGYLFAIVGFLLGIVSYEAFAAIENIGYRQLTAIWQVLGLIPWSIRGGANLHPMVFPPFL
ncbi:MAG: hypothetical protein AB1420_03055 [Bacillota bacterium]